MRKRRTNIYIVGAGFSKYAGLRLQSDFTEALLAPRSNTAHPIQDKVGSKDAAEVAQKIGRLIERAHRVEGDHQPKTRRRTRDS